MAEYKDNEDGKTYLPTRPGGVTGGNNERTMIDKVEPEDIRTVRRLLPDGSTVQLDTRNGFPRFQRTNVPEGADATETFPRSFIATSETGASNLLTFNDTAKTVSLWKKAGPPSTYYIEEKNAPIADRDMRPRPQEYADAAYVSGTKLYVSGRAVLTLSGSAKFCLFSPSNYQTKYVIGALFDGRFDYSTSLRPRSKYSAAESVAYTVALNDPPSINFGTDNKLSLLWGSDASSVGSVIYSVTPEAVTLVSEVENSAPTLIPITLSAQNFSLAYSPSMPWDIAPIRPRFLALSSPGGTNYLGCYYGARTWSGAATQPVSYMIENYHTGTSGGYTVVMDSTTSASYGPGEIQKSVSFNSRNEAASGALYLQAYEDTSYVDGLLASGWTVDVAQPSASYPYYPLNVPAGTENKWILTANTSLVIENSNPSSDVYSCTYSVSNSTRTGVFTRADIWQTSPYELAPWEQCQGENGYRDELSTFGLGDRWSITFDHPYDEIIRVGPNIDGLWEKVMFHDPDNNVKVWLTGEITVRCTNRAINRLLLEDTVYEPANVEFLSAQITMDLHITTPGGTIVRQLLDTGTVGSLWGFNTVQVNFIPNSGASPGAQVYVPVFKPLYDTFGQIVPPKEQGQVEWLAYETAQEFAARTTTDKTFRFLMCHKGPLPIPLVVMKMFMAAEQAYPTITHPFYAFVEHQAPNGDIEEPDVKIQVAYNQEVDWVAPLFGGNPHAALTRI